jgi:hypothetical protein
MTSKTVKQYKCDFCGKKNYSASHMIKHEKRCTLNPNRECGMCNAAEAEQPKMVDMLAVLPDPDPFKMHEIDGQPLGEDHFFYTDELDKAVDEALPKLRDICNNCPACIMSALRQKGIPAPVARNFHYEAEKRDMWSDLNPAPGGCEGDD